MLIVTRDYRHDKVSEDTYHARSVTHETVTSFAMALLTPMAP